MNRTRTSRILPLVILASVAIWAAGAADTHSQAATLSTGGAYAVTFHVKAPSTVPDGATITCKASITPERTALEQMLSQTPAVESAPGVGTVVNSSASCTAMVPHGVASGRDGGKLSYQIDALTASGPIFARTQQNIGVELPQAGTTAKLNLYVSM